MVLSQHSVAKIFLRNVFINGCVILQKKSFAVVGSGNYSGRLLLVEVLKLENFETVKNEFLKSNYIRSMLLTGAGILQNLYRFLRKYSKQTT